VVGQDVTVAAKPNKYRITIGKGLGGRRMTDEVEDRIEDRGFGRGDEE
jgi:hypothetical protein